MRTRKKYNEQPNPAPNTCEFLVTHIKKKRISKAALSRHLKRNNKTLVTYLRNQTMQTAVLWEICHALKHNFFADMAAQLLDTFSSNVIKDNSSNERITMLEHENELLKAKIEALQQVFKRE